METRVLGRTGLEVSVIGLGTEHLAANLENMNAVLDTAVSGGINYIDIFSDPTAEDLSEYIDTITPAIRRHRNQLILCLHWGLTYQEPIPQCQIAFDLALESLGDGYAEIAMVSMVDTESSWNNWAQKSLEQLQIYQHEGHVGYLGMSGHNTNVMRKAVESDLIDVIMFPINLYQHEKHSAGITLLNTCLDHQVGVVAMKPYYGGRLLKTEGRPTGITPEQCLHYVLSQPVHTTVPGARNAEEVRAALNYQWASDQEKQFVFLNDELTNLLQGQCVNCLHCLPCPQNIKIPLVITNLEYVKYYSGSGFSKHFNQSIYANLSVKASACIECGVCVDRCPFNVDIIGKMKQAAALFEGSEMSLS